MKVTLVLLGLACAALAAPTVDPALFQSLQNKGTANIIISFKGAKVAEVRNRAVAQAHNDRASRRAALYTSLKAHADETQASTLALLNKAKTTKSIVVRQLWISNQLIARGADEEVVKMLMASSDISNIRVERIFPWQEPADTIIHPEGYVPKAGEQWGVAIIDAPSVWAQGNNGTGTVLANIDTGVRGTHVALRDNHRSSYGWYDPEDGTATPNDSQGHGTHTMGTIAGTQNGIGVAPGAQWIACKGCGDFGCSEFALLECGQWVTCPTDVNGENPDCSMAPDVSSNSWGGGQGDDFYDDIIAAWIAGDIAPIFSIGNDGPSCGTANSPGDSTFAIAVGSTTSTNGLSSFSSVGPTYRGRRIKPDIAAPGSNVISASHTSDTGYATKSGTSMACPHVSGLVGLLRGANRNINVAGIRSALTSGAVPTVSSGRNCGGIDENAYPNHHVGAGRISAPASVAAAIHMAA